MIVIYSIDDNQLIEKQLVRLIPECYNFPMLQSLMPNDKIKIRNDTYVFVNKEYDLDEDIMRINVRLVT